MKCWHCGTEITTLSEVKDLHQLGLSLQGECPSCGAVIGVNSLWRKRYEQTLADITAKHRVDYVIKAVRARDRPRTVPDAKKGAKKGHSAGKRN